MYDLRKLHPGQVFKKLSSIGAEIENWLEENGCFLMDEIIISELQNDPKHGPIVKFTGSDGQCPLDVINGMPLAKFFKCYKRKS